MQEKPRNTIKKSHKTVAIASMPLLLVALVTLAVFALYVSTLGKQSLWFDEGLSVIFAGQPLPQLLQTLIHEDLHPPLYYLLLHFWMILVGQSELAVRMPSVVAAVLLVPLAYAVVEEVWRQSESVKENGFQQKQVGLAAAALIGSSPFIAYYAQEARMYSLAACLALATTWAFLRATRNIGRRWWLAFSCLLAAGLYTYYLSAFIVPALLCHALLFDRKVIRRMVLYILLVAVLYLPWIMPAYLQLGRLLRAPDYWVTTRIHPAQFLQAMWDTFLPSASARWGFLGAALSTSLIVLMVRQGFKLSERRRRAALVFLTFLIPLALTYITVRFAPKFATRYAIVALAPLDICIALLLYAVLSRKPLGRALLLLLIVGVVVASLRSTLAVVAGRENARDDARALAAYLSKSAEGEDAVLLVENAPYALQYYYRGYATWYGLHVGQDLEGAARTLNSILQTHPRRVWLVLWHHEFADPTDMVVTELMRVGREMTIPERFLGYQLRAFDILPGEQSITAYPQPQSATDADFAPGLRLLGFDRLDNDAGQLHYVLYWQAQQRLERNYSLTLSFQDEDGNEYLRFNRPLSTDYFLPPAWPLQTPIRGRIDVALPADLPPLTYQVRLQVWDPIPRRNVDLVDRRRAPLGQSLLLEQLRLSKDNLSANPAQVENLLQADMGDGLQLLGFYLPSTEYGQGDTLRLTLCWQSLSMPAQDHWAHFRLLDARHVTAWESRQPLLSGHPTTCWRPGESNRVIYRLPIPPDIAAGDYTLQAGTESRGISLVTLRIASRQHTYQIPPMQQSLQADFEQGIRLLGYDLQAPVLRSGQAITVTLYWQARQSIATSYKVSVQMLSQEARILAQEDSIPARWSRPTTAWLPGEVITDEHVLLIEPDVAPGDYTLIVALYDESSGQRLRTQWAEKASDHLVLTTLCLEN